MATDGYIVLKKYQNKQKSVIIFKGWMACHPAFKNYIASDRTLTVGLATSYFFIFLKDPFRIRQAGRLLCSKLCIIYRRQCKTLCLFKYLRMVSSELLRPSSCPLNIQQNSYKQLTMNDWGGWGAGWWGGVGWGWGGGFLTQEKNLHQGGPQLTEAHICRGILCHKGTCKALGFLCCLIPSSPHTHFF